MRLQVWIGLAVLAPAFAACSSDLPAIRKTVVDGPDGSSVELIEVKLPGGDFVPCDSPEGARGFVTTSEGTLMYAGQALMNQTCARGQCHNTAAEGENRLGAPAGLDFDLPVVPMDASGVLDEQVLLRLGLNQRAVYDWRDDIWKQVQKGHMPPGGKGQPYREDPGLVSTSLNASGACVPGDSLLPITEKQTRDTLGVWLACGSPLVESSDTRQTGDVIGTVGRQVPACAVQVPPPEDVTFDQMYDEVIAESCVVGCHAPAGARAQTDYSTPEIAYQNMVDAAVPDSAMCGGNPEIPPIYVVPGDPEQSYLLHKMGDPQLADPSLCGLTMPFGLPVLTTGTALVRAWIEGGAPAPGEPAGGGSGADAGTGADAGVGTDAGGGDGGM